jgi:hypothetical protein
MQAFFLRPNFTLAVLPILAMKSPQTRASAG